MLYRYINISVKYKIVYIFFQQNKMRSCFVELNIIINLYLQFKIGATIRAQIYYRKATKQNKTNRQL